jgi:allene oxide cyclase
MMPTSSIPTSARHRFRRPVVGALAAGLVIGALGASALLVGGSAGASSEQIVEVIEHAVTDTTIHTAGPGDVAGNTLVFHNKVYGPGDTRVVGHDEGFCTRLQPSAGSWECLWTTFLPQGHITVQGPYYDTRNSVMSITGGTGAYQAVRGEMDLDALDGGAKYDFIFRLAPG